MAIAPQFRYTRPELCENIILIEHSSGLMGYQVKYDRDLDDLQLAQGYSEAAHQEIGETLRFVRDKVIYAEGSRAASWYQVISGAVRLVAQLSSELRHVERFCFKGECFGFDLPGKRSFSAEAVEDCVVHC
jgi:CRP-like cAMP-binding protein